VFVRPTQDKAREFWRAIAASAHDIPAKRTPPVAAGLRGGGEAVMLRS
jgi:hypothetical protein